jgi:hypothetical protein
MEIRRIRYELGVVSGANLTVETINGDDAAMSPYVDALSVSLDVVRDYKRLFVSRRY